MNQRLTDSRLTDSRLANIGARTIQTAYITFQDQFQAITERARSRFDTQDWAGLQDDTAERLGLTEQETLRLLARAMARITMHLGEQERAAQAEQARQRFRWRR